MRRRRHPLLVLTGLVLFLHSIVLAGDPTDAVWVRSEPSAEVIVDGEMQGTTPLCLELAAGVGHSIRLERAGYEVHETIVRPVFSCWGFVRRMVFGGGVAGAAETGIALARGGGRRLTPRRVDVILERTARLDARLLSRCLVP